ncbi:hypothetical protein D3C76_01630 [compost metagenome]
MILYLYKEGNTRIPFLLSGGDSNFVYRSYQLAAPAVLEAAVKFTVKFNEPTVDGSGNGQAGVGLGRYKSPVFYKCTEALRQGNDLPIPSGS